LGNEKKANAANVRVPVEEKAFFSLIPEGRFTLRLTPFTRSVCAPPLTPFLRGIFWSGEDLGFGDRLGVDFGARRGDAESCGAGCEEFVNDEDDDDDGS
jgi:hypothetical protein